MMARKPKEEPIPEPMKETPADRAKRQAAEEGERRRKAYLASLDPREREQLAMGG